MEQEAREREEMAQVRLVWPSITTTTSLALTRALPLH